MPVISFAETRPIYRLISRNIGRIPSRPLFPGVDVPSFKNCTATSLPSHCFRDFFFRFVSKHPRCSYVQTTNCPRGLSFSRRKFNEFIVFTSSVPASFSRHIVTWLSRTALLDSYCDVFLIVLPRHERADDLLETVSGLSLIPISGDYLSNLILFYFCVLFVFKVEQLVKKLSLKDYYTLKCWWYFSINIRFFKNSELWLQFRLWYITFPWYYHSFKFKGMNHIINFFFCCKIIFSFRKMIVFTCTKNLLSNNSNKWINGFSKNDSK